MSDFERFLAAISPRDDAVRQQGQWLARQMDGIVEALVRERMQPHDIDLPRLMDIVRGRLETYDDFTDRSRTFVLDGRPLVRFYAPDCTSDGQILTVTQRYQVLA